MTAKKKNNSELEKLDIEMSEEEFARFYLAQTKEGSNVYFACAKGEASPKFSVYYQVLPGDVRHKKLFSGSAVWKFALTGVGIFAIFAVVFSSFNIFDLDWFAPEVKPPELSVAAYDKLVTAQDKLSRYRFLDAMFAFHEAYLSFEPPKQNQSPFSALLALVGGYVGLGDGTEAPVGTQNIAVSATIEKALADAGRQIAVSFEPIFKVSSQSVFLSQLSDPEKSVGRAFHESFKKIKQALEALDSAKEQLSSVNDSSETAILKSKLSLLSINLENFAASFDLASWMFGTDSQKKFLIVFQNTSYPRPTGGVVISYGLLESQNGYLKKINFDDARNLDGQLAVKIIPPIPLRKAATFWNFQNANWFLDFPTSAAKLAYFYEKTTGSKVDGVIALNDTLVKKMLGEIGPLDILRLGITVGANDLDAILAESMRNVNDANKFKRILNNLFGIMFEKIPSLPAEKIVNLFSLTKTGLDNNDVLVWFNHDGYQKQISGYYRINDQPLAVLSRIDTEKEGKLKYSFSTKKDIGQNGGRIIETSIIVDYEKNNAEQATTTKSQAESVYLRVYVPLGSILINASGDIYKDDYPYFDYNKPEFQTDADARKISDTMRMDSLNAVEIYEESGRTVFGAWVKLTSEKPARAVFKAAVISK